MSYRKLRKAVSKAGWTRMVGDEVGEEKDWGVFVVGLE